jgi:WD40 repeat protein
MTPSSFLPPAADDAFDAFVSAYADALAAGLPLPELPNPEWVERWAKLQTMLHLLNEHKPGAKAPPTHGLSQATVNYTTRVQADASALSLPGLPVPTTNPMRPTIGRYTLECELGRGGMGVVYLAHDPHLGRAAAVKVMNPTGQHRAKWLARFAAEGRWLARQQHPHIVQVFDADTEHTPPYLAMEYIPGPNLHQYLGGQPLAPRLAAHLVAQLADALAHAHERGVVHRDLKPANVLLQEQHPSMDRAERERRVRGADASTDVFRVVKLTDFGLATTAEDHGQLTGTDDIVGTPSYMAPEVAAGKPDAVGPNIDIYGLGTILYEALTGRPPFQGTDFTLLLLQIQLEDPIAPQQLNPAVPRDLNTICLKCLRKSPQQRYATAQALADDLHAFRAGRSIVARPQSAWDRTRQLIRRYPGAALVLATLCVSLAGFVGLILTHQRTLTDERDRAVRGEQRADQNRAVAETRLVELSETLAQTADEQDDPPLAGFWYAVAAQQAHADPERQAFNRLRANLFAAAAPVPWRAWQVSTEQVPEVLRLHPHGQWLLSCTQERWQLWDVQREAPAAWPAAFAEVPADVAFSPDGRWLAAVSPNGAVRVCAWPGGQLQHEWHHATGAAALAFDVASTRLAVVGTHLHVWALADGAPVGEPLPLPAPGTHVAFDAPAQRVVVACQNHSAVVFDLAQEKIVFGPQPTFASKPSHRVTQVPGFVGTQHLVTWVDRQTHVWDVVKNERYHTLTGKFFPWCTPCLNPGRAEWLNQHHLQPADHITGTSMRHLHLPRFPYSDWAAFSTDGTHVLTNGAGLQLLRADGRTVGPRLNSFRMVGPVAVADQGRYLAACNGRLVRVWQRTDPLPVTDWPAATTMLSANGLTLDASTRRLVVGAPGGLRVVDLATNQAVGPTLQTDNRPVRQMVFSPDGTRLWATSQAPPEQATPLPGRLYGWTVADGQPLFAPVPLAYVPRGLVLYPDGQRLLVQGSRRELELRDSRTGRVRTAVAGAGDEHLYPLFPAQTVVLSPDGRTLVTCGHGRSARRWDADTLAALPATQPDLPHTADWVEFSADGRYLAVLSQLGKAARVYEARTGLAAGPELPHPTMCYSARFNPAGTRLLIAGTDGRVAVWDWATGTPAMPALPHADNAYDSAFSPDGRWVATVAVPGVVRIWDAERGVPATPPIALLEAGEYPAYYPFRLAWAEQGRSVLLSIRDRSLHRIDVRALVAPPPDERPIADVLRRAELQSTRALDAAGRAVALTAEEWFARWQARP